MKNIMTNNDLRVGMVLTTKNNSRYVVIADDNGHYDVLNLVSGFSNGIEVGDGHFAVCGGKKGGRDIVKVQEFTGCPTRNRLSEALKFMTGADFTEKLVTVWEAENPEVIAAKAELKRAADEYDKILKKAKAMGII